MSSSSDNTVFDFGSSTPSYVDGETSFERYLDYVLGLSFLITAGLAFSRMRSNTSASTTATETTVVTAFYSLIFATSVCRSLYFLVPASVWQPSYTPSALYAFDSKEPWIRYTLAECTVSAGSLCLFSIFILILVYWSDILQKYCEYVLRHRSGASVLRVSNTSANLISQTIPAVDAMFP